MPNIPHFVGGQFGKLNADALNTIVDAVNDLTAKIEASPNQVSVSNAPRFPIFAQITSAIEEGERIVGYAWKEMSWDSPTLYKEQNRKYDPDPKKNTPIALPMNGITPNQKGVVGQYVWLYPANFAKSGDSYLLFQENYVSLGTFIGRITTGQSPIQGGVSLYQVERLGFNKGEIVYGGQVYDAYNGTEILNGAIAGGYSTGTGDCDPIEIPLTIKEDTLVVCVDVSNESGSRLCIFNHANDLVVDCNCAQLLSGTTSEAQTSYADKTRNGSDDGTPNYSAERAMQ